MDWVTVADYGTAIGTLVLAIATFAATRSANRSSRIADRQLAAGIRPLLVSSREQDPAQTVGFADRRFVRVEGGRGTAEVADGVVYLTMSLRNIGAGLAVLHGWDLEALDESRPGARRPDPATFVRLRRDIYVPAGDYGFWQGALRDPSEERFAIARTSIEARQGIVIHVLYSDVEGGQRVISRFVLQPADDDVWLAVIGRHWNIDHPDPR